MENNTDIKTQVHEILDAFKIFDGIYKREQVEVAIQLKDEITPSLIMILEDLISNPNTYVENHDLYDHIYAVMLLGHFRKLSAHKLIIDIFSLPNDLPNKLFGEIATSDLPTILVNTCGGSVDHIKSMILDKKTDDFCRASACQALAYAVVEEYTSRKEVLEFFGTLFTGNETDGTSNFWGFVASVACDLYPEEIIHVIKKAYEDGLIMPGVIGYQHFEEALSMGKERCLEEIRENLKRDSLDDLHGAMSWWACFDQGDKKTPDHGLIQTAKKVKKKKASAKKKKRKQAKKSRKKNRR